MSERCPATKVGEFNPLLCCRPAGHDGYHNWVPDEFATRLFDAKNEIERLREEVKQRADDYQDLGRELNKECEKAERLQAKFNAAEKVVEAAKAVIFDGVCVTHFENALRAYDALKGGDDE